MRTIKDLTNMDFGYLHVVKQTDKRIRRRVVWECQCKCGKTIYVPSDKLICGRKTSCGCKNNELSHKSQRNVKATYDKKNKKIHIELK